MGRSVSVPSEAVATAYITLDDDLDPYYGWDDFVEGLRNVITEKYPSFQSVTYWVGNEDHAILENGLAQIVVAEYMGLVSVSLVALKKPYDEPRPLAEAWCNRVAKNLLAHINTSYGESAVVKVGRMSNGGGVYRRVNV